MRRFIEFPLPPTMNETLSLAKSHWSIYRKAKEEWSNTATMCAHSAKCPTFDGKVWTSWWWFTSTKANDPDNLVTSAKYILDGLTEKGGGFIKNDNLNVIQQPFIHWFPIQDGSQTWFPKQVMTAGEHGVILLLSSTPIFNISPAIGYTQTLYSQGLINYPTV